MTEPLSSSIAMCTYNGERFLQKQLESFVQQSILPDELVVCDDGSTDKTLEILNEFQKTAPFDVQIIQNEKKLGYARNFEKAGQLCSRSIVFFSDQDDVWLPQKNEQTLRFFEEHPDAGLVLLEAELIDAEGEKIPFPARIRKKKRKNPPKSELEPYFVQNALHHWIASWQGCNMAYRNSLRESIYPICMEIGHDQWILLILGTLSETLIFHTPTLQHRIHNSNASRMVSSVPNLFQRACYSLLRHQNSGRYRQKAALFQNLLNRIAENPTKICHPELIPIFERFQFHMTQRAEALENGKNRFSIVLSEFWNGNYSFCSHGLRDVLSDLLAVSVSRKEK